MPRQRTAPRTARLALPRRRRDLRSAQVAVAALAWIAVIGLVSQPSALAAPRSAVASSWAEVAWFWGISRVEAVACPSSSMCIAGGQGAVALRTTNGGRTWVGEMLPSGVTEITGVACPSKSVCEAIGHDSATSGATAALLRTTDGGVSWVSEKLPAGMGGTVTGSVTSTVLNAIACPSKSICEAVGGFGNSSGEVVVALRTTDGGRSWVRRKIPGNGTVSAVACPSASTCDALFRVNGPGTEVVLRTTNGGKSWSRKTVLTGNVGLEVIACPSTSTCMAGGDVYPAAVVLRTTNGGKSWAQETLESQSFAYVDALASRSTSVCEALTYNDDTSVAWRTTDAGTKWVTTTLPLTTGDVGAIACSSTSVCVAAGYGVAASGATSSAAVVLRTTNNAKRWVVAEALSTGITELNAIACRSASVCEAGGDSASAVRTTDGGTRWVSEALPAGVTGVETVACPSTLVCEAVDGDLAFRTTDGGKTWVSETLPSGSGQAEAIACPSTSVCEAVGETSTAVAVTLFACPSTSACPVLDASSKGPGAVALRTTDGGRRWVSKTLPSTSGKLLNGVACPTTSICEAIGWTPGSEVTNASSGSTVVVFRTTDEGASWRSQTVPPGLLALSSIACPSPSSCDAVGYRQGGAAIIRLR